MIDSPPMRCVQHDPVTEGPARILHGLAKVTEDAVKTNKHLKLGKTNTPKTKTSYVEEKLARNLSGNSSILERKPRLVDFH
ncbi:unnamed protein product [Pieris brassicae]|uniref:Uncharacterized protein n=1 Tax=Pieris brassicae TaxID=7116 RepID=A0A9P0XEP8_PIEBR|nr:unnamed protein product [Pieris brassicae]